MIAIRRLALWVGLALVFLCASPALAQRSGGSFGGGSFGGGGGGFSGGGGGYGGSYGGGGGFSTGGWSSGSYGGSSYGGSYSSGGSHGSPGMTFVLVLFVIIVLMVLSQAQGSARRRNDDFARDAASYSPRYGYLSVLSVSIDGRSRAFLQNKLNELASSGDTGSNRGLSRLLREVALLLRRSQESAVGARPMASQSFALGRIEQAFREQTENARSKFRYEAVRNADGQTSRQEVPASIRAREEEGDGLVVVSLIIASRQTMGNIYVSNPRAAMLEALNRIVALKPHALMAMEVVWSPAEDRDRMSSAEQAVLYPEIAFFPDVRAGRHHCDFCGGPYALELKSCPHCGAPNPEASTLVGR